MSHPNYNTNGEQALLAFLILVVCVIIFALTVPKT